MVRGRREMSTKKVEIDLEIYIKTEAPECDNCERELDGDDFRDLICVCGEPLELPPGVVDHKVGT
jgi:hypothetical protein